MAKKRAKRVQSDTSNLPEDEDRTTDGVDEDGQESSDVAAAEEAVRLAKKELKNAQQSYRQLRSQASDQLKQVRETSVGELVEGTLKLVKKHPGPGVAIAAIVGFFLGRLFRR